MNTETVEFYDGLAADYHLVYGDFWDEAVARQGAALARLIHGARPDAMTVLDCSCGIGTQAIGLAREGFRVTGTDISEVSILRARAEAARLGAEVEFGVADFRDLRSVPGLFDVVLSADNALPHLLDDANLVVQEHNARYRAITRHAFTDLLQQTGFASPQWRTGAEAGFHQPVVVATAP